MQPPFECQSTTLVLLFPRIKARLQAHFRGDLYFLGNHITVPLTASRALNVSHVSLISRHWTSSGNCAVREATPLCGWTVAWVRGSASGWCKSSTTLRCASSCSYSAVRPAAAASTSSAATASSFLTQTGGDCLPRNLRECASEALRNALVPLALPHRKKQTTTYLEDVLSTDVQL